MAIYITEMTIDDVGSPEPISPDILCARLTVIEKAQAGTTALRIYNATDTTGVGVYNEIPAGLPAVFPAGVVANAMMPSGVVIARAALPTGAGSKTYTKIHEF